MTISEIPMSKVVSQDKLMPVAKEGGEITYQGLWQEEDFNLIKQAKLHQ